MTPRNRIRGILSALVVLALLPASAAAAPKVDGEFPVPGLSANNKIVEGQDGNMWVAVDAAGGQDVARITPSGAVKEYELTAGVSALEGASGIARDAEGRLWVTGEGKVARFMPADPPAAVAVEDLAQAKGEGAGGSSIVLGPDGNMWVATAGDALKFPPSMPDPETTRTLFPIDNLAPHDIDVAGQLLAIADQNSRVVTLTTEGVEKDFALESAPGGTAGFSQGLAGTKSGEIAYSEPGATPQLVGLISPPKLLPPIKTPAPGGDPFGVAVGSDGAFWFVMSAFNELARLAPGQNQLTFVPGLQNGSLARQIAAGPNNTLWVTVTKAESESVARVTGLEPPAETKEEPKEGHEPRTSLIRPLPGTVVTRGKKAKVSFRFRSTDASASFQCRVVRRGGKKRAFAPCSSPKSYRVKPGRYAFEVRAVLGGVVDRTPARRNFRVVHVVATGRA